MTGKLHKRDDNTWVVIPTNRTLELPTHPDQNFWLKMFAVEDADVCFEIKTIADGSSEWDIMDVDVAWLIPCQPDTRY